ncbi:hypothetical protein E0H62_15180 [Rhizobium leguminosarum bv. viciae]|nr:hypothetical protein E0H62_15180 [Rhizobium leguminosarum bv. viciae]
MRRKSHRGCCPYITIELYSRIDIFIVARCQRQSLRIPFDESAADVLCERAMFALRRGQRYIYDHLIRTFSGLMATRVNAPSLALSH